jgi:hypothetical protein
MFDGYFNHLIFIISIQPLGWFGHEQEPIQATGMALVRCILGKFLGVVCHCFPLLNHLRNIKMESIFTHLGCYASLIGR